MTAIQFTKPFKSYDEQLTILKQRGLKIVDEQAAKDFLAYSNYYRFSGYILPFETSRHSIILGTTFEQVQALYEFDRKLRNLTNEAVAVVEVFSRSTLAYCLSKHGGAFAHLDKTTFFCKQFDHNKWYNKVKKETQRSQEVFVFHFKKKYSNWPDLPIWTIAELLSFGSISQLYGNLQEKFQKEIAIEFAVPAPVLVSWLHTLVVIRNLCAHHSRLWNRELRVRPQLPHSHNKNDMWKELRYPPNNSRIFLILSILKFIFSNTKIQKQFVSHWNASILELINSPPNVPRFPSAMGIPADWKNMPIWK